MINVDSQEKHAAEQPRARRAVDGASHGVTEGAVPGGPTRFEAETSVLRSGPGEYLAILDESWWIIAGPNGGYVAAVVLRAMIAEVDDPDRKVRSMTIQYLRPPVAGETTVEVTIERSGRTVSNVTARMVQSGRPVALAMAAFGIDREDTVVFDETDGLAGILEGAVVPPPEQVPVSEVDPDRDVPLRGHYDLRWVVGDLPFSAIETDPTGSSETTPIDPDPMESDGGAVDTTAEPGGAGQSSPRARSGGWLRPAEAVAIDAVVLAAMSDAWMPPIFSRMTVPLAVPTVDLTIHFRDLPADPLGFCFVVFDSPVASHGYTVEHGRILSPDGRLLVESRQLAVLV